MTQKIKISTSKRIARSVLMYLNSGVDPQAVDINDKLTDGWMKSGWDGSSKKDLISTVSRVNSSGCLRVIFDAWPYGDNT